MLKEPEWDDLTRRATKNTEGQPGGGDIPTQQDTAFQSTATKASF